MNNQENQLNPANQVNLLQISNQDGCSAQQIFDSKYGYAYDDIII